MGVLNVTPDSFSDGGRFVDRDRALDQAIVMHDAGAAIIDVGGESTRPGAAAVAESEELDRVIPVIERICRTVDVAVSVDTSKPAVMQAAVAAGAGMINDVCALRMPGALEAAAESGAAICLMHMRGGPRTMQDAPSYHRLPGDILDFLERRLAECREAGIPDDRLSVDPGFGFGKNDRQNLRLLARLDQFRSLRVALLVGLSRKRTLGNLTGKAVDERLPAGLAAAVLAVERGANIVRTHDVAATVDALTVTDAVARA